MCKICSGYGYVTAYKSPRVVRECCKCEIGQRKKENVEKQMVRDHTPVWELFTL